MSRRDDGGHDGVDLLLAAGRHGDARIGARRRRNGDDCAGRLGALNLCGRGVDGGLPVGGLLGGVARRRASTKPSTYGQAAVDTSTAQVQGTQTTGAVIAVPTSSGTYVRIAVTAGSAEEVDTIVSTILTTAH